MTDLKLVTSTEETKPNQPTPKEVQASLEQFNTSSTWVVLWFRWFVWEVIGILSWKQKDPAELINTLADERSKILNLVWKESVNDGEYLKNWTNIL